MFIIYFYEKIKFFISYMLKKLKKKTLDQNYFYLVVSIIGAAVAWSGVEQNHI